MSCVPCVSDGDEVVMEDADRWSDSLGQVLGDRAGRRALRQFLETRGLDDAVATLVFWEQCNTVLMQASHSGRHPRHHHHHHSDNRGSVESLRFWKEARDLVELAEQSVNLDLAQMQELYTAVEGGREGSMRAAIAAAMQSAHDLLRDEYQLFRRHLLREKGLTTVSAKKR